MSADATYQGTGLQRRQDGTTAIPSGGSLDIESGGALKLAGTALTATAAQINQAASAIGTVAFTGIKKIAKVALAAVDTGGGIFSWQNPEAGAIAITEVLIDVTTPATGACSIDVGVTSVSGTTADDTLIDGLDIHSAAGLFNQSDQAGANGKTRQRLAAGKWVTGSKDTGNSAGVVGNAYISYVVL